MKRFWAWLRAWWREYNRRLTKAELTPPTPTERDRELAW